ncbi:MAG: hypothetical protein AB1705_12600 [Verrucomicrobiota bacterium]
MKAIILSTLLIALPCASRAAQTEDYIAHEWGTFTSVQSADGTLIPWNPGIATDLPTFVYNRSRPGDGLKATAYGFGSKLGVFALHRMETPVIYFYSDRERTVNVKVNFPQGTVTEWYPRAQAFGPVNFEDKSYLDWGAVQIAAPTHQSKLPLESAKNHYYAARETDANLVRVANGKREEWEKFLFYRGLGQFPTPLRVLPTEDGKVTLQNVGEGDLKHLFILRVRDGKGTITYHPHLPAQRNNQVTLEQSKASMPLANLVKEMNRRMAESLTKEGLFPKEAESMVKTWHDSWFEETGLRVLYVIPGAATDKLLPLRLEPQPKQIARVFVGRTEVIEADVEWDLLQQIVRYTDTDIRVRNAAVEKTRNLGLGRFANAAVSKLLGPAPSPQFRAKAHELLNAMNESAPAKVTLVR